jgi:hypothetical protein
VFVKISHVVFAKISYCNECAVFCYSDNLIPELPNTVHSCSWHGPAAASLTSVWPGNVIPVPETSIQLGVGMHCLTSSQHLSIVLIMSLIAVNYFVRNV